MNCPKISITANTTDAIFASIDEYTKSKFDINDLKNNSMLLLDGIHKTKDSLAAWLQLTEHTHVRVTIDLFYCGIVFFRKEQAKEHFKIRI